MIRRWLLFLVAMMMVASAGLADAELRGYDPDQGYVYVLFGAYPQVIDGGIPDDGRQALTWRKSYQKNKAKGEMRESGIDPAGIEPTPILWRVLRQEDGRAFLLSEYILFPSRLHESDKEYRSIGGDFRQTDLCRKLNGEFLTTAFQEAERQAILLTENEMRIFLLTAENLKDKTIGFGTNKSRKAWATEYAVRACGAFVYQPSMGNHSPYWLQDQSQSNRSAGRCTKQEGDIGYYNCRNPEEGVRPAFYLDLNAVRIGEGSGTKEDPYRLEALPEQ